MKEKGISLIVLIVTIAVIIILTGVVIVTVSNNRPIESANEAKDMHNESVLLENAEVLSTQYTLTKRLDGISNTREEYVRESLIKKGFPEEQVERVDVNEQTGRVTLDTVTAKEVAENPSKYYGVYVTNYEAENSGVVGWRVFYSDKKNIYLIADDYIPYDIIPLSKNGTQLNKGSLPRSANFANIINEYNGASDIMDLRLIKLNQKYYDYLYANNIDNQIGNMSAVAYMLDINAWSKFKGEYAEYAIGGTSIEMFIESYNIKHNTTYVTEVERKQGYSFSGEMAIINLDKNDSLYFITDKTNADAMWLSSPGYHDSLNVIDVYGAGSVVSNAYDEVRKGFRPLICLKLDIVLQEQAEERYKLV